MNKGRRNSSLKLKFAKIPSSPLKKRREMMGIGIR
jgi:hypothetical protein